MFSEKRDRVGEFCVMDPYLWSEVHTMLVVFRGTLIRKGNMSVLRKLWTSDVITKEDLHMFYSVSFKDRPTMSQCPVIISCLGP